MYETQDTQITAAPVRKACTSQFGSKALSPLPGFGLPGDRHRCLSQSVVCAAVSEERSGALCWSWRYSISWGRHSRQHLSAAPQHNPTHVIWHGHCSHHVVPGTMSHLWKMVFGKSRWHCTLIFSRKNKSISWQHSLLDICYICFLTEIRKWNYNISM